MSIRHKITNPDLETRTGTCSVCGPVGIMVGPKYKGRSYWRCGKSRRWDENSRYRTDSAVREAQRQARFKRLYGITVEEYAKMLEAQEGVCARCKKPPQEAMALAVDHCHKTGRVRGLLCGPCNTYLGRLEANLDQLQNDLNYLNPQSLGSL